MRLFGFYIYLICFSFCLLFQSQIQAQSDHTPIFPLRIPIEFSGSFAELRNGHFHGGVDYRTQQREGLEVVSIDDGWIYRIGISPISYGKVLYIKHANYISVYGHLSSFPPHIDSLITLYQYTQKSNEIDWLLEETIFVNQGDTIAYSGNTGSSGGPHLHFEIRNSSDQYQINPCLLGLCPTDNLPPSLLQFALYPLGLKAKIQNTKRAQYFQVKSNSVELDREARAKLLPILSEQNLNRLFLWHLRDTNSITLSGEIGFGIEAIDLMSGSPFKFGLYRLSFWVDTQCIYSYQLDSIPIAKTNAIDAHIDYPYFISENKRIEHSKKLPFNELDIYTHLKKKGSFLFSQKDTQMYHRISVLCEDFQKNASLLQVDVSIGQKNSHIDAVDLDEKQHSTSYTYQIRHRKNAIIPDKDFIYETNSFSVFIPANSIFDTAYFEKNKKVANRRHYLSPFYHIPLEDIPLKQNIDIAIVYQKNIPKSLLNKLLILHIDKKQGITPLFSTQKEEKIHGISQKFGTFVLGIDTIAPKIETINLERSSNTDTFFKARISDELSGVGKYEAFLDGKWLRLYYDKKTRTLCSDSWEHLPKGKYELRIYLEDEKENGKEYNYSIIL